MFYYSSHSSGSPPSYDPYKIIGKFLDAGGIYSSNPPPSVLSSSHPSSFLSRSSSSHSLPLPSGCGAADPHDFQAFDPEPVRRVFSAGDLQCMNGSIHSADVSQDAAAGRIGRYSAEERKERIERYRTKRNQRNFHKKITYACRKTLADSRPRVRGRFARNGDTEHEAEVIETGFELWNSYGVVGEKGSGAGGSCSDWWKQMQAALVAADEEERGYDEDLWASFESVLAMNLT